MKTLKKIVLNIYNYLLKIVSHPSLNFLFTIIAIFISWITLNHADKQFALNSKSSDILFNVQLRNSKELNESLINQIKELQNITKSQLDITDEQLGISKKTLNEQIYSGRPQVIVASIEIRDTNNIIQDVFSPKITAHLQNNGKRFALKCVFRPFVMDKDYKQVRYSLSSKDSFTLEPDISLSQDFFPKIPLNQKNDFYYFYEISYYDDALKRTFKQSSFFHYFKMRNELNFNICRHEEKEIILKKINEDLKIMNEPLFSNE